MNLQIQLTILFNEWILIGFKNVSFLFSLFFLLHFISLQAFLISFGGINANMENFSPIFCVHKTLVFHSTNSKCILKLINHDTAFIYFFLFNFVRRSLPKKRRSNKRRLYDSLPFPFEIHPKFAVVSMKLHFPRVSYAMKK